MNNSKQSTYEINDNTYKVENFCKTSKNLMIEKFKTGMMLQGVSVALNLGNAVCISHLPVAGLYNTLLSVSKPLLLATFRGHNVSVMMTIISHIKLSASTIISI